jgi:putative redox protein
MAGTVSVTHLGDDRFEVAVRQHRLHTDQPIGDGGSDTAPTPVELFVSSLAACVAFYARRYLSRHDLSTEGLGVEADFSMAGNPTRVDVISIRLGVPAGVPREKLRALAAVVRHCTVHNTLETPPTVNIDFVPAVREAA